VRKLGSSNRVRVKHASREYRRHTQVVRPSAE
jgi:hypothetical protein